MSIKDTIKENVYMEMCRYCPRAKECHDNCCECDDYHEQVKQELKKYGINESEEEL